MPILSDSSAAPVFETEVGDTVADMEGVADIGTPNAEKLLLSLRMLG